MLSVDLRARSRLLCPGLQVLWNDDVVLRHAATGRFLAVKGHDGPELDEYKLELCSEVWAPNRCRGTL